MVRDPIRVTYANFLKCYIKTDIICKFLENTMKKKYWQRRYFGQKMAKNR